MRAHAHHTYETTVDGATVSLSVAPFADESEAAWRVADTDPCWEAVWRGSHDDARQTFILLKEALKAGIHPERWIWVDGGTLKYD